MSDRAELARDQYLACATALLEGLDRTLASWVVRGVERRVAELGADVDPSAVGEAAAQAGRRTRDDLLPRLRALLLADVDEQVAGPLALVRAAVGPATEVLDGAGVPAPRRDAFAERAFPDDRYDLGPATFDDIDPSLHDLGLAWGAAKAQVVLLRHRA